MGATVFKDTIYVSKTLDKQLTGRERKVLLAHEVAHYLHKDRILLIPIVLLFFWCPLVIHGFKRWCELRADEWAIRKTKDILAFITLMGKLTHGGKDHPSKERRIRLAESLRGKI